MGLCAFTYGGGVSSFLSLFQVCIADLKALCSS
jgi:hypothetical protein